MAGRDARRVNVNKRISVGNPDEGKNVLEFAGYYVGKRQQGAHDFGDGKLKPTIILYFLDKNNMEVPLQVYQKGDMKFAELEIGKYTTLKWIKLGRPEGAKFKTNMYKVTIFDDQLLDVSHVALPESYTEDSLGTDDSDSNDEAEESENEYSYQTGPVISQTASKVQELLRNKGKKV